jgi:hypothetical protein
VVAMGGCFCYNLDCGADDEGTRKPN